jgi:predicted ester cyclase
VSADENVAAVRDFVARAWNAGDPAAFEEHLAPDFAYPGGREGFKAMVLGFRSAFPDLVLEVEDIFGAGDKVVTRFTVRGTHQRAFMGVAPTGRQIAVGGIAIDVMREGRRTAGWAQLDRLELLTQLGGSGSPPARAT